MNEAAGTEDPPLMCARHAQIHAVKTCQQCGAGMCDMCGSGTDICKTCSMAFLTATSSSLPTLQLEEHAVVVPRPVAQRPIAQRPVAQRPTGAPPLSQGNCVTHPEVPATVRCSNCGARICNTCDFEVTGVRRGHLCPTCAMIPNSGLLPERKKFVIWGFVMAVWGTVGLALLLGGFFATFIHDRSDLTSVGYMILIFVFSPALLGFGLSMSAQEKNLPNPPVVWVGVAWNALLVTGNVILTVMGNLKS